MRGKDSRKTYHLCTSRVSQVKIQFSTTTPNRWEIYGFRLVSRNELSRSELSRNEPRGNEISRQQKKKRSVDTIGVKTGLGYPPDFLSLSVTFYVDSGNFLGLLILRTTLRPLIIVPRPPTPPRTST